MREKTFAPDWWLFVTIIGLVASGLALVYDASYAYGIERNLGHLFFLKRQVIAAAIGLAGMGILMRCPHWRFGPVAVPALILSLILLVAVLKLGVPIKGARRWLDFGPLNLQPSEIAKIALLLFLARVISAFPQRTVQLWTGFVPLTMVTLAVAFLIEVEPDLGTAITVLVAALAVLWMGGAKGRWIAALVALCLLGVAGKIVVKGEWYRIKRVTTFLQPAGDRFGAGYQVWHSTLALGTGGWTGMGLGESREKRSGALPEPHTDFIFAILGEEGGLVGSAAAVAFFLIFTIRGYHIAFQTRDPFGRLLAGGITTLISGQALLNIGVVTASVPATGVPLPFLSYGGSSLVMNLLACGMLLSVSQRPYFREDAVHEPRRRSAGEVVFRKAGIF